MTTQEKVIAALKESGIKEEDTFTYKDNNGNEKTITARCFAYILEQADPTGSEYLPLLSLFDDKETMSEFVINTIVDINQSIANGTFIPVSDPMKMVMEDTDLFYLVDEYPEIAAELLGIPVESLNHD